MKVLMILPYEEWRLQVVALGSGGLFPHFQLWTFTLSYE